MVDLVRVLDLGQTLSDPLNEGEVRIFLGLALGHQIALWGW